MPDLLVTKTADTNIVCRLCLLMLRWRTCILEVALYFNHQMFICISNNNINYVFGGRGCLRPFMFDTTRWSRSHGIRYVFFNRNLQTRQTQNCQFDIQGLVSVSFKTDEFVQISCSNQLTHELRFRYLFLCYILYQDDIIIYGNC